MNIKSNRNNSLSRLCHSYKFTRTLNNQNNAVTYFLNPPRQGKLAMLRITRAKVGSAHNRRTVQKHARVMIIVNRKVWHESCSSSSEGCGVNVNDDISSIITSPSGGQGMGAGPYIVRNMTMIVNKLYIKMIVHTAPGIQHRRLCVHPRP